MKTLIIYLLLFVSVVSFGQHAVKIINNINPSDKNYSDLQFLDSLLMNKSIVLLGEDSHYDGSTSLAKVRLIKYLHEKLGFNILIDEVNIYEAYRAMADVKQNKDSLTGAMAVLTEIFPFQIAEHNYSLAKYIDSTIKQKNELNYYGFDIVPSSPYSLAFPSEVMEVIERYSNGNEQQELTKCWKDFFDIGKIISIKWGSGKKVRSSSSRIME